jgi:hypothetical protein
MVFPGRWVYGWTWNEFMGFTEKLNFEDEFSRLGDELHDEFMNLENNYQRKKKWNEEEKKGIGEEDKAGGILVFSHLSDEFRGIFVHSSAYESISSATSSD